MKRLFPLLSLLAALLLLPACGQAEMTDNVLQSTELMAGSHQTTQSVTLTTEKLSSKDGTVLTLSVENRGESPVLLTADLDFDHKVTVAPGQTGVLTQKVSGVPKTYPFEVHAEEAGSLVDVVYAVTQSTT